MSTMKLSRDRDFFWTQHTTKRNNHGSQAYHHEQHLGDPNAAIRWELFGACGYSSNRDFKDHALCRGTYGHRRTLVFARQQACA